ncbi:MAG: bifunctional UDP-N-acetylglucosamine diphosphorylase/glucosamine-1-phosphate N-acetyltransferase GlmU [Alphaproteobacteria bacterium]|nr:bifunctional UDP-N-acetylglucosamine diphosphorylase/glucosamine-1-phosphate N-acetyltransferase GlmU [Alphaproteobacteria bacterium]
MRSSLPKVLHPLAGKAMLCHVLHNVAALKPSKVCVVIAPEMDEVRVAAKEAYPDCIFAVQDGKKHGTAAAVMAAEKHLKDFKGDVLVLFGDTPLITSETLVRMLGTLNNPIAEPVLTVLGMYPADPAEYGRLVINSRRELEEIVEFKDASPVQRDIGLCNSGVMAIKGGKLLPLLAQIDDKNSKGEYYLTDLVKVARSTGLHCAVAEAEEAEVLGVNSRDQLAGAEGILQTRLRKKAMQNGATLIAPETVFFSHDTELAADVVVYPYVYFGTQVKVGNNVEIRSFSHIDGAHISNNAIIGPYARLRPGAEVGEAAHVGNFVEIKKSTLESGVKVNHLSYIGDAYIGAHSNIGAGTITCNYDGYDKHCTRIGAGAFIGSNTSLVAPVSVGAGAIIGAGSVVSDDVEPDALALTRAVQSQKKDWAKHFRNGKHKKRVN